MPSLKLMQAFKMQKTEKREFGLTFRAQTYQNKRQKAKQQAVKAKK
jgi:hypothetical protein